MREYKVIADRSPFLPDRDEYGPFTGRFAWFKAWWVAHCHVGEHPCGYAQVLYREVK